MLDSALLITSFLPCPAHATTKTVISGALNVNNCALSTSIIYSGDVNVVFDVVAEAVREWLEHGKRRGIRLFLRRVGATRREWNLHGVACALRGLFDRCGAAQHDQVRERNLLATLRAVIELALNARERAQHLGEFARLIGFPIFLRCEPDARAVRAAAFADARNVDAEAHAVDTSRATDSPDASTFVFSDAMSLSSMSA